MAAYLVVTQSIAQGAAVLGFSAAVRHVWPPASIALLVSGLVGITVYGIYYQRLDRGNAEPDDPPAGS